MEFNGMELARRLRLRADHRAAAYELLLWRQKER
jgi:hypothetical protein